jgi:hypothetical protein
MEAQGWQILLGLIRGYYRPVTEALTEGAERHAALQGFQAGGCSDVETCEALNRGSAAKRLDGAWRPCVPLYALCTVHRDTVTCRADPVCSYAR